MLSASPAQAQCREWHAGFEWTLQQGDLEVFLNLRQRGQTLSGEGAYRVRTKVRDNIIAKDSIAVGSRRGIVAGSIDGNNITLDMDWEDGSGGSYKGVIGPTGIIRGTVNVDKTNPGNVWNWVTRKPMFCADNKSNRRSLLRLPEPALKG